MSDGRATPRLTTARGALGASEPGRFTAVRTGGLAGQTFEIEIFAPLTPRTPAFVGGYVTATTVLARPEQPEKFDAHAAELNDLMVRAGRDQPPPSPRARPRSARSS